jgi:hypothetical protein
MVKNDKQRSETGCCHWNGCCKKFEDDLPVLVGVGRSSCVAYQPTSQQTSAEGLLTFKLVARTHAGRQARTNIKIQESFQHFLNRFKKYNFEKIKHEFNFFLIMKLKVFFKL